MLLNAIIGIFIIFVKFYMY